MADSDTVQLLSQLEHSACAVLCCAVVSSREGSAGTVRRRAIRTAGDGAGLGLRPFLVCRLLLMLGRSRARLLIPG